MKQASSDDAVFVVGGEGRYPVIVGHDIVKQQNILLPWIVGKQVLIVTSNNLSSFLEPIQKLLSEQDSIRVDVLTIPDGDQNKSLDVADTIWQTLITKGHRRDTTLIALGGGVIGDMVGFVAATYLRGVAWINFPTTLLAQVDAAIGGKTAINHKLGKNLIGAFHAPRVVFSELTFLDTLPDIEYHAGLAEVVKYGLALDGAFFQWLEEHFELILNKDHEVLVKMVRTCTAIKAEVVSQDFKEQGKRALLNFGHTVGHAIETLMQYKIRHGEAVSIGMLAALRLSYEFGLEQDIYDRALLLLKKFGLPVKIAKHIKTDDLLEVLLRDKKNLSDEPIRMVMLSSLGSSQVVSSLTMDKIESVLLDLY